MPKVKRIVAAANIKCIMCKSLVETKKVFFSVLKKFACGCIYGTVQYSPKIT